MPLRTKLLLSYIVLITIPIVVLSIGYRYAGAEVILTPARQNVLEIVVKNNQIIDERLARVRDESLMLMVDCSLFEVFRNGTDFTEIELLQADREIRSILSRHFGESDDLFSAQVVTQAYLFGDKSANTFPSTNFYASALATAADAADGRIAWVPSYTYAEMYQLPTLRDINVEYRHLFSAVREINPSCVRQGVIIKPLATTERPVLLLNFTDAIYTQIFQNRSMVDGSSFFVVAQDGTVVAQQDSAQVATIAHAAWLPPLLAQGAGTALVDVAGATMIACYATSSVTGWMSVILIPPAALMREGLLTLDLYTASLGISLLVLSLLFAYLISARITSPISKLLQGIRRAGSGDFAAEIAVDAKDEFGDVLSQFNRMNGQIRTLIEENFVAQLREKETEILALNIQLNPHFLYNTLNTINWLSIYGSQEEVSKMLVALSRMLHYTTDHRQDLTSFSDDLAWLQDYIAIMNYRFDRRFEVAVDVAPELLEASVPKLFLQPLVENAILHGFQDIESGGLITIYGRRQGVDVHVCVEDNGIGISAEKQQVLLDETSTHVGLRNVDKRIKLRYGSSYGINIESEYGIGTRVRLTFPYRRHLDRAADNTKVSPEAQLLVLPHAPAPAPDETAHPRVS